MKNSSSSEEMKNCPNQNGETESSSTGDNCTNGSNKQKKKVAFKLHNDQEELPTTKKVKKTTITVNNEDRKAEVEALHALARQRQDNLVKVVNELGYDVVSTPTMLKNSALEGAEKIPDCPRSGPSSRLDSSSNSSTHPVPAPQRRGSDSDSCASSESLQSELISQLVWLDAFHNSTDHAVEAEQREREATSAANQPSSRRTGTEHRSEGSTSGGAAGVRRGSAPEESTDAQRGTSPLVSRTNSYSFFGYMNDVPVLVTDPIRLGANESSSVRRSSQPPRFGGDGDRSDGENMERSSSPFYARNAPPHQRIGSFTNRSNSETPNRLFGVAQQTRLYTGGITHGGGSPPTAMARSSHNNSNNPNSNNMGMGNFFLNQSSLSPNTPSGLMMGHRSSTNTDNSSSNSRVFISPVAVNGLELSGNNLHQYDGSIL
ncbi:dentin sialophosphoprotein precursor [Angomonas deanei]|uniref:Uncharacterized protein n=1 Tax=Angomonas deanei TaxID=59799 RepID=A0A7G2CJP4_9TRYP|nr:dentin sialophosphoprotein precursor [Angomonas deanei]CAD2218482.1 hypothetical protein, conserved [Angomonas deanei]|eukprot:EPY20047.1 dentin sialophosphoprotein precursor [Angomonas deanei]